MTLRWPVLLGWLVVVAAVIGAGVQLSQFVWHAVDAGAAPGPAPAARAARETGMSSEAALAPLVAAAPFGARRASVSQGEEGASALQDLTLQAVRQAKPESASTATIALSGGKPKIYRIGETVGGLAKLTKVEPRRALLTINGTEHSLEFPMPQSRAALTGIYAAKAAEYGAAPTPYQVPPSDQSAQVTDSIRRQIAANPQTLIDGLDLEATESGYLVGPNTSPVLLAAGLMPGDRVIRVNGADVGNVENDRKLFEEAVASGRARVDVMRGGQTLSLSFPLR